MRIVRKRFAIALGCLAVSAVLTWKLMDIVDHTKETTRVLRVTKVIEKGTKMEPELLTFAEIGAYGTSAASLTDKEVLQGKYAAADLFPGDNLTMDKFITFEEYADNYVLKTQHQEKMAVSVAVRGISASVSGKLKVGDIVSALVYVDDGSQGIGRGSVRDYAELRYLEIAAITNSKADDILYESDQAAGAGSLKNSGDEAIPASVTFIADGEQALRLVEAENIGTIHLVFRGRGEYGRALLEKGNLERAEGRKREMESATEPVWVSEMEPGQEQEHEREQEDGQSPEPVKELSGGQGSAPDEEADHARSREQELNLSERVGGTASEEFTASTVEASIVQGESQMTTVAAPPINNGGRQEKPVVGTASGNTKITADLFELQ